MAALILPRRFSRQPNGNAVIDRAHPSAWGLAAFVAASERSTLIDYANPQAVIVDPYAGGDCSFKYTGVKPEGRWRNTGGGNYRNTFASTTTAVDPSSAPLPIQRAEVDRYTTIAFFRPLAAVGTLQGNSGFQVGFGAPSQWTLGGIQLGNGTDSRITGISAGSSGTIPADALYTNGQFYAVAYAADYGNGLQRLFINGVQQSSTAAYTDPAGKVYITWTVYANRTYAEFYGALFFNRLLQDEEIRELSRNPWQLLKAPPRRLFVVPTAANDGGGGGLGASLAGAAVAAPVASADLSTALTLAAAAAAQPAASAALTAPSAPVTVSFVGEARVKNTASGTTLSTTPARVVTAGNSLFVHVSWSGADTPVSVTDNAGNTYTQLAVNATPGGTYHGCWFYCLNAIGNAAQIVTVTWGSAQTDRALHLGEFSSSAPLALEQVVLPQASATGTSISSAAFNTASAGLILAGTLITAGDSNYAFGANYTALTQISGSVRAAYRITTGALTGEVVTFTGGVSMDRALEVTTFTGASTPSGAALTGSAAGQATATAALTTSIALTGTAAGQGSASGALSTAIVLAGTAGGTATAAAGLTTAISLVAAAAGAATAAADLSAAIALTGAASAQAGATADLTTEIALAGSAAASVSASASLTAPGSSATLAGSATAQASAAAELTAQATLAGAAQAAASTQANLTTVIRLDAAVAAQAAAAAALTTGPRSAINASAQASAAAEAELTANIVLSVSAGAYASAAAELTAQALLTASTTSRASASAALTTSIRLAAAATSAAQAQAALTARIALQALGAARGTATGALTTRVLLDATAHADPSAIAFLSVISQYVSAERTLRIAAEDRRRRVGAEDRRRFVAGEDRIHTIAAENRELIL